MSVNEKQHWPALGGQPRQKLDAPSVTRTAECDLHPADSPTSTSPTPVDEYSTLVKALYEFAPNIREVVYSEQSYIRSFEIESAGVWERFAAAIRRDNATVLQAFIKDKLRFWIDLHPRDGHCLLHLNMIGPGHDLFGNVFITALSKRLDAIPTLFPNNIQYLGQLRRRIKDTGSENWRRLNNKMPDKALCFRGRAYGVPAIIIEIGNSQNWEGNDGVKNKAIQYEEDSEGTVTGVLYLGLRERSIAMIGSRSVFPNCPRVKYLDGTLSTHAVEVISLTSLTDPANTEGLLSLKFAHFAPGGVLLGGLRPEEQNMGFFFTFKEILQMMESIDKDILPSSLPIIPMSNPMAFVPLQGADLLEGADSWESVEAIRASLFTTPPNEESDGESSDKEWNA